MAFLSAWLRKAAGSSLTGGGQKEEKDWLFSLAKRQVCAPRRACICISHGKFNLWQTGKDTQKTRLFDDLSTGGSHTFRTFYLYCMPEPIGSQTAGNHHYKEGGKRRRKKQDQTSHSGILSFA
jgi:hypothetical protein